MHAWGISHAVACWLQPAGPATRPDSLTSNAQATDMSKSSAPPSSGETLPSPSAAQEARWQKRARRDGKPRQCGRARGDPSLPQPQNVDKTARPFATHTEAGRAAVDRARNPRYRHLHRGYRRRLPSGLLIVEGERHEGGVTCCGFNAP
eukprot:132735-Chlamydomonas_euryale.AAC.4